MPVAPGSLLVATPLIVDGDFHRAVVLVCSAENGHLGVILDRPTQLPADDTGFELPWAPPAVVHVGGPVQPDTAVTLARVTRPGQGWTRVIDDVGLAEVDIVDAATVVEARIFSGYAGWSPGQLEAEIAEGGWFLLPCHPADPFTADGPGLWAKVVRRGPGSLPFYANAPDDPTLN